MSSSETGSPACNSKLSYFILIYIWYLDSCLFLPIIWCILTNVISMLKICNPISIIAVWSKTTIIWIEVCLCSMFIAPNRSLRSWKHIRWLPCLVNSTDILMTICLGNQIISHTIKNKYNNHHNCPITITSTYHWYTDGNIQLYFLSLKNWK